MKPQKASALTLGVAVALVAGVTLGNGGANVMPVFVDDFASRFKLSDSAAGLVAATQLMATASVTLLLAKRAARSGRVRMTRLGLAVAAVGFLGATAATDPVTLILANLILGANQGPGEGIGFLLMALGCLVAWPLVRRLPDGPATPGTAPTGAEENSAGAMTKPSVVLLAGTALLWAVTQGAWSYASVLGRQHTGMSHSAVSLVLAVSSVVALVGAVVGPFAARHFGRMRSMAAFVVAQAVAMAVLIFTHDPVLFVIAAVLWQACQLAALVQTLAAAALIDPTGHLVASLSGAGALGTGIGPLAVGAILDGARAGVLSLVLAIGTVAASLPLLRMTVAGAKAAARRNPAPVAAA
ncbi:MFS transporter [Streptomyces shenzhenensis]|uniref:MFS transporter n=1 Tax=Streptomyces shenzhenensis TaxID=943815 RepID=UPI0033D42AC4